MVADVPVFNKDKHVSYWLRCLKSPLPTAYISNDANRMTLAFFTLSALDLLGVLFTRTTSEERSEYIDWIYRCQHPDGGLRGFPGTDYGRLRNHDNAVWDPANLAATFFGISALCVLGDDLGRLDRRACLNLVKSLQLEDGGFAELKGVGGELVGGADPRFAYMGASLRWMLRGTEPQSSNFPDIHVQDLLQWISRAECRNGGFAEHDQYEAHAGLTFCAIAALNFLGRQSRPDHELQRTSAVEGEPSPVPNFDHERTVEWLVNRFTTELTDEDYDMRDDCVQQSFVTPAAQNASIPTEAGQNSQKSFEKIRSVSVCDREAGKKGVDADAFLSDRMRPVYWAAFGGRCNKIADTCYAFWAGASLKMLGSLDFVRLEHVRDYLVEKTQNMMLGGFGKLPGDLPDVYHSYLGLAALALIEDHQKQVYYVGPDVEEARNVVEQPTAKTETAARVSDTDRTVRALDPVLCMSTRARKWIESLPWHQRD